MSLNWIVMWHEHREESTWKRLFNEDIHIFKATNPYFKRPFLKPNFLSSIPFKCKARQYFLALEKYHQKEKQEKANFLNVKIWAYALKKKIPVWKIVKKLHRKFCFCQTALKIQCFLQGFRSLSDYKNYSLAWRI